MTKTVAPNTQSVHFDIFTLFPEMFIGPFAESIIARARANRLVSISTHNIRHFTTDRHRVCDGTPYGGGGGMVMKPEPIFRAAETVLSRPAGWVFHEGGVDESLPEWNADVPFELSSDIAIILLTPQGRPLSQAIVGELSSHKRLALICGRYEGVDERVRTQLVTDEISIGDYVLSGGELAAMVVVDAVTRTIPGALGHTLSAHDDSHSPGIDGLLEGPHYTRPPIFRDEGIPDVLLSGHHANIDRWRRQQSLLRTFQRRPDLINCIELTAEDRNFLKECGWSE